MSAAAHRRVLTRRSSAVNGNLWASPAFHSEHVTVSATSSASAKMTESAATSPRSAEQHPSPRPPLCMCWNAPLSTAVAECDLSPHGLPTPRLDRGGIDRRAAAVHQTHG
jgi:hypothetical protein